MKGNVHVERMMYMYYYVYPSSTATDCPISRGLPPAVLDTTQTDIMSGV